MNKIYAILYNAYEIDDIERGDLTPIYCSLSQVNRDKKYDELVEDSHKQFNKYSNEDDYWEQNDICDLHELNYSIGKWSYHYRTVEYDLDKDLRYEHNI